MSTESSDCQGAMHSESSILIEADLENKQQWLTGHQDSAVAEVVMIITLKIQNT